MPYDAASGMWFTWRTDPQTGEKHRDFLLDAEGREQTDDRFAESRPGQIVQVREFVSTAPPGRPESWPDTDLSQPVADYKPNRHARRLARKLDHIDHKKGG